MKKYVYSFGAATEGDGKMKDILGGKGAGLAEMCRAGLPVPPGFTISTEVCNLYFQNGNRTPDDVENQTSAALTKLEREMGRKLGDTTDPLLVSVRSGAKFSMPGMMDTILNLGLNDTTVVALEKKSGNPRFAQDCYRRFIQMFGAVVLDIPKHDFDAVFEGRKKKVKAKFDTDLTADDLKAVIVDYKKLVQKKTGKTFPQDAREQLVMARDAVFRSWHNPRAIHYRKMNGIPDSLGTAVNVQAMVFGNLGETSATGVGFTRNPSTGENKFYGEFLINAQGEDVVAGIRTPIPCEKMGEVMPKSWKELLKIKDLLEKRYRDVQDFEFTIEKNKLYMLQTRNGKRTAAAAVRIAVEMVKEKLIDEKTAVLRVDPASLDQLLHPTFNPRAERKLLAKGLPASPGAAVGKIAFTAQEAEDRVAAGEQIVLVRRETEPADIGGMHVSEGILTSTGGMTSHAAVVARGMGTPCVAGAGAVVIDAQNRLVKIGEKTFGPEHFISLDGATGEVMDGSVSTVKAELSGPFKKIMEWADNYRTLKVR